MTEPYRVVALPGEGIGPEVVNASFFLHYQHYFKAGFPIATGVIEGACRYLVKDRIELTGDRWSLYGAEAVLCLHALHEAWRF